MESTPEWTKVEDGDDDVNKGEECSIGVDSVTNDGRDETKQPLVTLSVTLKMSFEFTASVTLNDLECRKEAAASPFSVTLNDLECI